MHFIFYKKNSSQQKQTKKKNIEKKSSDSILDMILKVLKFAIKHNTLVLRLQRPLSSKKASNNQI